MAMRKISIGSIGISEVMRSAYRVDWIIAGDGGTKIMGTSSRGYVGDGTGGGLGTGASRRHLTFSDILAGEVYQTADQKYGVGSLRDKCTEEILRALCMTRIEIASERGSCSSQSPDATSAGVLSAKPVFDTGKRYR